MATSGSTSVGVTAHDTLTFYWSLAGQNVSENYSDINWSMVLSTDAYGRINSSATKSWSVSVNGAWYSGNNTVGIGNNSSKTLASGSTRIYHNSDGTKSFGYSFSQYFAITFSGNYIGTASGSGSGSLPTIPRATTPVLNSATVTMGETMAISLPRATDLFTHILQYDFLAGSWTTFAEEVEVESSFVVPEDWAELIPDAVQGVGRIRCITYNDDTLIGEKIISFTAVVPDDVVPTVETVTVTDATAGIAEKFGAFLCNKSQLRVESEGTGAQGSTISTYKVEVQGISYTGADITTYIITVSGTIDVKVTVTDSRGRHGSKIVQVNLLEYFTPTITNFDAFRAGEDGSEESGSKSLKCVFDFTIASCGSKNDKFYKIEYKRNQDSVWSELVSGSALYEMNTSYIEDEVLELEYAYDVRLTITDYFTSATYELKVGSEIVPLCVHPSGKGLGIGGYPTEEALQIFFAAQLHNNSLKFMDIDGKGTPLDVLQVLLEQKRLIEKQQQLITELNGKIDDSDSGWIRGGYKNCLMYRKKNGFVTVIGSYSLAGDPGVAALPPFNNGYGWLGTLPNDFCPSYEITGLGTPRDSTGYEFQYNITLDGNVQGLSLQNAVKAYWTFNVTYPV